MRNRKTILLNLMLKNVVMCCCSHVNCLFTQTLRHNLLCSLLINLGSHTQQGLSFFFAMYRTNTHGRFFHSVTLMGRHLFIRMNHQHQSIIPGLCLFIYMAVYHDHGTQTGREGERERERKRETQAGR